MNAIVQEAHMWGGKLAVHACGTDGIKAAIRAGADSIEPCSFIDAEGLALAKIRGTYPDFDAKQFQHMIKYGMTPMQAIRAATSPAPT